VEEWRRWARGLGLEELGVFRTTPSNLEAVAQRIANLFS